MMFSDGNRPCANKKPESIMEECIVQQSELKPRRLIGRKDFLIMLIVSVVYAVFAYCNLGHAYAPQTFCKITQPVTIVFDRSEQISEIRYYGSIGQGNVEVCYSDDNEHYSVVPGEEGTLIFEYANKMMYTWRCTQTDVQAQYIQLRPESGEMNILEIAFFDAQGEQLPVSKVISELGEAENICDEQELVPAEPSYLDEMYFDEIYHARTAYEHIHQMRPYEITHPPLGKIILSVGIQIFGMNPFGWRFMGTLFGVLMLPLIYLIAKLLFGKTKYAFLAMALFALDFMHFSQTRIATIDSYSVFFILLMYLFMLGFYKARMAGKPLARCLLWLFLCGLAFGLGAATKWLCIYAGIGLLVIFIITLVLSTKRCPKEKRRQNRHEIIRILLCCIGFFIAIPVCIYLVSYIPYTQVTQDAAYGFGDILENQKYMLNYHGNLNPDHVHPFASAWYTWPLDIRPLLFYSKSDTVTVSTMSTMGNPLIWIGGFVAVIWLIVLAIRKKLRSREWLLTLIFAASQLLPWCFVSREVFIYHYFATVPFLILLLVYFLRYQDAKHGWVSWVFLAVALVLFIVFYPVISGLPVPKEYAEGLRWLPSWPFY